MSNYLEDEHKGLNFLKRLDHRGHTVELFDHFKPKKLRVFDMASKQWTFEHELLQLYPNMDIQFWSVERERKIFESMQPYMPELKPTPEFLCYQKHEITRPPMNNRTFRVRRTDIASCVNATLADLGKTMLSLEAQGKTAEDVPWLPYKKCNAIWFDVFHCLGFEYRKSLSVLKTILDPAVVEIPAVFTLTKGHEKPAYAEAIGFAFKDCPDEERKRILDEEIAAILPPDREWVSIDVEPVTTRDEPMLSVRGILQKK